MAIREKNRAEETFIEIKQDQGRLFTHFLQTEIIPFKRNYTLENKRHLFQA